MRESSTAVTVVLGLLTMPLAAGGCGSAIKVCDVSLYGIRVQAGVPAPQIYDEVRAVCDQPPAEHMLRAWIEYRPPAPMTEWISAGRQLVTRTIPPRSGQEFHVQHPCLAGSYRTRVEVSGLGPEPSRTPFRFGDTGEVREISAEQCRRKG